MAAERAQVRRHRHVEQRLQAQGKLTEFQAAELKEHFSGVRGLGAKQVSLSCDAST